MKQITPAQHLAATAKSIMAKGHPAGTFIEVPRFAKLDESQADAIKRLMTALKRNTKKAEPRQFPKDSVSLSCTKNYVEKYYHMNNFGRPTPFTNLSTAPTTWPEGPEVEVSEVDDDITNLI